VGQLIWSIIALLGAIVVVGGLCYFMAVGDDREEEEAAREHFARHGRWPDEGPDARA
jgi:flagellar basal body-associated protein FliL